ncbi:MAG TPA: FAD-dependent monooxygenase [Pseudonocardiaceae bacterium]|nr:FAD-dependent monooxygenase [Pseudonocardiaceae bacterium]
MTDSTADFCVVGAGPAGLTLALLLARSAVRVTVVERSRSLDREFRGDILQPGGMRLLHELGVLDAARERGAHEHDGFVVTDRGRVLLDSDYRRLPGPFNCLLSIPQRNLLDALLAECRRYDGFTYVDGSKVTELIYENGVVRGVMCGANRVLAHCVVGADGRYSKVRQLAGIGDGRIDNFDQDVMWFKLPAFGQRPRQVRVFRESGNPAIAYASAPDSIQCGWTLPHKAYRDVAGDGIGPLKEKLCAALPPYAELIDREINGIGDLTLLDVFSGNADTWVRDGLVLIGDAAHTHGPIGAQGINLAIQDAVLLHPVLMESLRAKDTSAVFFDRYTGPRRRDINRIMKIQGMQGRMMLAPGGGRLRPAVAKAVAKVVARGPIYRRVLGTLAFGNPNIAVAAELFAGGRTVGGN